MTQVLNSYFKELGPVHLPYKGRRHYMHSFDLAAPAMLPGFEDYHDIVVGLCRAAGAVNGMAHMTVDERLVLAGSSQRRPRPHVDGCFMPGEPHPYLKNAGGRWGGGGWLHTCNDIKRGPVRRMPVIVAASVAGCRAWRGTLMGTPTELGDLSHIYDQLDEGFVLPANTGFLLSPDCVHESMIMQRDVHRTFLRIALPVGLPV